MKFVVYISKINSNTVQFSMPNHTIAISHQCALKVLIFISLIPIFPAMFFSNSKCKEFIMDGKIHADCSQRGLVNLIDSKVHREAMILNLKSNEIHQMRDEMFKDLYGLEEINLQSNQISIVNERAFYGLKELKKLDLSHNLITAIDVYNIPQLLSLNISFNPLINFAITSFSLEELDLSACKLSEMSFSGRVTLPNLQHLNLSDNFITEMTELFNYGINLETFDISKNPLICNQDFRDLVNWLKENGVKFISNCETTNYLPSTEVEITDKKLIVMPTTNKMKLEENFPEHNDLKENLEAMRLEQKLFAILILTILLVILILLSIFMIIYCYFRNVEKHQDLPIIDVEDDIPPPPYRTYMSGFSI